MIIRLIQVPFHLGREGIKAAKGPDYYLQQGLENFLRGLGHTVEIERVRQEKPIAEEVKTIFTVSKNAAKIVSKALREKVFPIILAGNCNSCLGTLAGTGTEKIGVIWFDAHGDFNTPEITITGYFDGMPLAVVTGHCYQKEWRGLGVKKPFPEDRVILAGIRDLDPLEKIALEKSRVSVLWADDFKKNGIAAVLNPALEALRKKVDAVYLHIDVDSIDYRFAPGVDLPNQNGFTPDELTEAFASVAKLFQIKVASFTVFNPEKEKENRTTKTVFQLIQALIKQLEP